jgi:hypothetical protein
MGNGQTWICARICPGRLLADLPRLRHLKGLSQEELAYEADVTNTCRFAGYHAGCLRRGLPSMDFLGHRQGLSLPKLQKRQLLLTRRYHQLRKTKRQP